jgi:chemotaxis protein MotA
MDLATIIGMLAGGGVILAAIFVGGNPGGFVDVPSVLIVIGGGLCATLIRFQMSAILKSLLLGAKTAFKHKKLEARDLIDEIAGYGDIVRKNGPLGLENVNASHPVLEKGLQFITDGYDPPFIQESLERERDLSLDRLSEGQRVFKSLGDAAPAFGMIGTLVGLVQMLATMDDPSTIGPSMAIALLTTLYGAVVANLVCLPVADKLNAKIAQDEVNLSLIIDGILQVREGRSPALIREMLLAYLPEAQREQLADAA